MYVQIHEPTRTRVVQACQTGQLEDARGADLETRLPDVACVIA